MSEANVLDADTALIELRREMHSADTLPDLPPDADAAETARAYADVVFRVLDRDRRVLDVLEAMQLEHKALRREFHALRSDMAAMRKENGERHDALVKLLSNLPAYR